MFEGMAPQLAIAKFWTRSNGATCLLYKREDGWWLTIEKDGATIKKLAVPSPTEGIETARQWRIRDDDVS